MPEVRMLPMKPDHKPTTPDGQPLRYGVCRCGYTKGNGNDCVSPDNVNKYGWCRCFCHEQEYARMKENKEDK